MNDDDAMVLFQAARILDRLQATGAVPRHAQAAAEMAETGIGKFLDHMAGHVDRDFLWIMTDEEGPRTAH